MKKYKLSNGLTVLHKKTPSKSVAIEVMIQVGSNYEPLNILGVSHFLEHMIFEGTKKRPTSREITNEIEKLGGYFNAYTSTDRTAFHIKSLAKHFDKSLDVISDIITQPLFKEKAIEKEKDVILKEIHMVLDDPRFYQWILFQKSLFKKHPAGRPTTGTPLTVKNLTKEGLVNHYEGNYTAENMIVSVVGGVDNILPKIEKSFSTLKSSKPKIESFSYEFNGKQETFVEKKKTLSAYMILGYKIPPRLHKDTYVLDVVASILGRGQSGKIFDEIRNKRGLSYEVGVNCESTSDHGFFSVHASINKEKIKLATDLILKEIKKINIS